MSTKKNNLKVSVPTVGTGGLKKILTVSVLYMGFSVERLGSISKKEFIVEGFVFRVWRSGSM